MRQRPLREDHEPNLDYFLLAFHCKRGGSSRQKFYRTLQNWNVITWRNISVIFTSHHSTYEQKREEYARILAGYLTSAWQLIYCTQCEKLDVSRDDKQLITRHDKSCSPKAHLYWNINIYCTCMLIQRYITLRCTNACLTLGCIDTNWLLERIEWWSLTVMDVKHIPSIYMIPIPGWIPIVV